MKESEPDNSISDSSASGNKKREKDESSPLAIKIFKPTEEVHSEMSSPPPSPLPMPTVDTPMQNSVIKLPEAEKPL